MPLFTDITYTYFNPRSHERSDHLANFGWTTNAISIHAPTRGATLIVHICRSHMVFQSTLPREERQLTDCTFFVHQKFQSTLPREERPRGVEVTFTVMNFNPRSHERSDDKDKGPWLCVTISIHAPTRGATDSRTAYENLTSISIHAPTRGATYHGDYERSRIDISIHAPTRGATIENLSVDANVRFQSTLPREERQQYCTKNLFIFIQYRQ